MGARFVRGLAIVALASAISASAASPAGRVIGGTVIQVQSAPWTVFVVWVSANTQHRCTGSIVDSLHVLTAAHCLYDGSNNLVQSPESITVKAGISNFSAPTATDVEQDRIVSSYRVHSGYVQTGSASADDVAMLALSAPFDLSGPAVNAVALPPPSAAFPDGAAVTIAGFGRQVATTAGTGPLESMTATIDHQADCGAPGELNGLFLCVDSPTGSVCNGDSGAGVVTTSGTPMLIGVVDASSCNVGTSSLSAYAAAPELLQFIQGDESPPLAPRPPSTDNIDLTWDPPLVAGATLTCSTDGWDPPVQIAYSFIDSVSGTVLQTSARPTFVIPVSGVGAKIACQAAVTNSGGTTVVKTESTAAIKPAPPIKIEKIAPVTGARGRDVTLRIVLKTAPPGVSGRYTACAVLPPAVGGQLCQSTHEPAGYSGEFPFKLRFKIKPHAPLGAATVTIHASAGASNADATARLRIASS